MLRDWIDLEAGAVLHTTPEPSLKRLFRLADGSDPRITTDYAAAGVGYVANLAHLPFADSAFANIVSSHVLEHVEEDERAMRELFRVLKPGDVAVICVPHFDTEETEEFGFADPNKTYHWRNYGRDLPLKLETAGFMVEIVSPGDSGFDIDRLGLTEREHVHVCTKPM